MGSLFKRTYTLNVAGTEIKLLRVEFKVTKSLKKEPNTLDLKITGLSKETRGKIPKKGAAVILSAGYEGNEAVIFSGDSRTVDHDHPGAEWITHIQCGDGEIAYQYSPFVEGFGKGTKIADVIRACARALGVNEGNLEDALKTQFRGNQTTFANGYTSCEKARDAFDKLMRGAGFTWSVQNGALQILKDNKPVDSTAVSLSADTGLIGSPEYSAPDKKGGPAVLKVKSLLQPQFRCGGIVEVDSRGVKKAQFRINKLEHEGDSEGDSWFSSLETVAV